MMFARVESLPMRKLTWIALLGIPLASLLFIFVNDARAFFRGDLLSRTGNQPPFSADRGNLENKLIYQVKCKGFRGVTPPGCFAPGRVRCWPAEQRALEGSNGSSGDAVSPPFGAFRDAREAGDSGELRRRTGQRISFYVAKASCKYSGYFSANETQPRVLPKSILISHFFGPVCPK